MPEIQLGPQVQVVNAPVTVTPENEGLTVTPEIERLNSTAVKQVVEIVEEAEDGSEQEAAPTTHWSYAVPMPGVRYFRYQ